MADRVRVRRERPCALSWALALMVTMLAVWLITLSPSGGSGPAAEAGGARVVREVALEGGELYLAVVGCFPDAAQARLTAAEYASRGAAGVIRETPEGWQVLGAGYDSRTEAERIAGRLAEEGVAAEVVSLPAGTVTLRITAAERDVQSVERAVEALRLHRNQSAAMALQLDRGEMPAASACTLAAVARSELAECAEALEALEEGAENPVCHGLLTQLRAQCSLLAAVSGSGASGAELSGLLRCCHVDGALRWADFLTGLGEH